MVEQKEEIVISGIGGLFPECDNMEELSELLFSKSNAITIDSRRWIPGYMDVICGTGKFKNINTFDATFFGVNNMLADIMEPMTRIITERSVEAIMDAGLNLSDVSGRNIGVFVGSAIGETEIFMLNTISKKSGPYTLLGQSRTMIANRVSNMLNLTGPSFATDGGWLCGSNGLYNAKRMIEDGHISAAIVGTINLVLSPELQIQSQGLNRLNNNTQTKPFSCTADGYNRSEGCVVMLLQRASEAKRSYCTLLNVKSTLFGDHQGPLINHVMDDFKSLLQDCYREANVDPTTVEYVEAYGSGLNHDDIFELNVMDEVFCGERRKTPLKVGSVKSNIGHCETTGFFISIVKAIIAMESGHIPPNIHYDGPNKNAPALMNGHIQVVTEKTPFVGNIIGVSGFGITNAFSHVILKKSQQKKTTPTTVALPQLILVSGRNEKNAIETIQKIKSNGNNTEYVTLTNNVFSDTIKTHFYRSYSIYPNVDESQMDAAQNINMQKRPVWFMFSGMGSQWPGMGTDLMKIPVFEAAINKCDLVLKPRGLCIKSILTSEDPKTFDNILHSFVGIVAVQIGLVDLLRDLEIEADGFIGHSLGEAACAYADGCFTAEETILSAYARGKSSLDADLISGMMAAIGVGYQDIKDSVPHDIDIACHNSSTSCTISGPHDSIIEYVETLTAKGIFAKAVNASGIAFHSRYVQSVGPVLLGYLKNTIKEPKLRSSKWICTSLPETEWKSELGKYSSAEYHTNNLLSSVLFEESLKHVPSDAILIEIAPHGLLQAIVKRALPETVINTSLTKKMCKDSFRFVLSAIGKLYTYGLNPNVQTLYPTVTFPVSRGTPFIHSLPLWDHNEKWTMLSINRTKLWGFNTTFSFMLNDKIHIAEYQIHDQFIIPLAFVLKSVWDSYNEMCTKTFLECPIQFQNLKFVNNFKIHSTNLANCYLMVQRGSGLFEFNCNKKIICSGQIQYLLQDNDLDVLPKKSLQLDTTAEHFLEYALKEEIYSVFEDNGYNLGDNYKNITNYRVYENIIQGCVKWKNDWIYFLDGLLKFPLLENLSNNCMNGPISVRDIVILPNAFNNTTEQDVFVNYNIVTNEIACNGIIIKGVRNEPIELGNVEIAVGKLEEQKFIQYNHSICKKIEDFIYDSLDIITEPEKFSFFENPGKLILCTLSTFDDPTCNACTNAIMKITENQPSINGFTMDLDNARDVSEDDESGRFIAVTNWNHLQYTAESLVGKAWGYIIVCSKEKCQDIKDWKIIIQQQLNGKLYLTLMIKKISIDENCIFINSSTNNDYDIIIWKTLEKYNSSNKFIYIVSKTEPLEDVVTHVNNILVKYKSQKLRFLFILDSNAPEIESNKLFYTNQLCKGLIINIYKNGRWGCYKRTVFENLENNADMTGIPVIEKIANDSTNELTVEYLGLNFKDLLIEDCTEDEFGLFEYSGISGGKQKVMGITFYNHNTYQIKYDKIFAWPVPAAWSLEEAATVPLAYTMNYYVFKILCSLKKNSSILVTSGLNIIGQAAISIGLAEKCDVYVIVESSQQSEQLSSIFPKLSRSKIIINTNNRFDIQLKMMTKSKGVDFIFNFLSGNAYKSALRTLAKHGKFFQFSKSDIKNQESLGTRIFLQNTAFYFVNSNLLNNESDKNKEIIKQSFSDGLKKGVVKPFQRTVLKTPISNRKLFEAMRTTSASNIHEKVIVCLNSVCETEEPRNNVKCNTYQCHPDHVYAIFDNKSDWLVLAEWLVNRGAQHIVIVMERLLISSIDCKRLNKIISQKVSVKLESEIYLNSKDESLDWLNRLTSVHALSSIFIIKQFDDNKINNLQYAFEKHSNKSTTASFVCISSRGENACATLKSIGFNALNIRWDKILSKSNNNISSILLPVLDKLLQKPVADESFSFVFSENPIDKLEECRQTNEIIANFFPVSAAELLHLKDKLTKEAEFVEVPSNSPKFSQMKLVIPVFVIPGFRPCLGKTLYTKLNYPVFEAQYPKNINSIDELSNTLVDKLTSITNHGYVSLIGDSWGSVIALKMAQILETRGTLVTISLLEGNPEDLTDWAKTFVSNDNYINKLYTRYIELSKYTDENRDAEKLPLIKTSDQRMLKENTRETLIWIRSYLRALVESKPNQYKLLTKVTIFKYDRESKFKIIRLSDYCNNLPLVKIVPKMDYKQMLTDMEMFSTLNRSMAYLFTEGIELSLNDKYKNFYYSISKDV